MERWLGTQYREGRGGSLAWLSLRALLSASDWVAEGKKSASPVEGRLVHPSPGFLWDPEDSGP